MSEWLLAQKGVCTEWSTGGSLSQSREGPYNTGQHLIQHCSETPPVDFEAVRQALDDLRSEVLGRAAGRVCCLRSLYYIWPIDGGVGETEIC